MNKIKTILALILIFVLLFSVSIYAFAEDAKFKATNDFLNAVADEKSVTCTVGDVFTFGKTQYERVFVTFDSDVSQYKSTFTVNFSEDGTTVFLYIPMLTFDEKDLTIVLEKVNEINANSIGPKYYVDTENNAVVAEFFLIITENSLPDIVPYATVMFIAYNDTVYELIKDYAV